MPTEPSTPPIETYAVLDEQVWRAWVHKSEVRERATFLRLKIVAGIVLAAIPGVCVFLVFLSQRDDD